MRGRTFVMALRALVIGAVMVTAGAAAAFERTPYTNALIAEARETGRPYIIFVHADWCTTCQAQDRILATLVDDPRFANLLIMTVDYDTKRNLMNLFNIPDRSTFVAFTGSTELGRSSWDTTPEGVAAFLQFAVDGSPNYVPGGAPAIPAVPTATPPATPAA